MFALVGVHARCGVEDLLSYMPDETIMVDDSQPGTDGLDLGLGDYIDAEDDPVEAVRRVLGDHGAATAFASVHCCGQGGRLCGQALRCAHWAVKQCAV